MKEISEIVLCKKFSSNCCAYGPDCKFQHRNNNEIKSNQQSTGKIHFNITHGTSNAEIQNYLQPNQTIGQQIHASKVIENEIIPTDKDYTSINKGLFTSIASSSKAVRRCKKKKKKKMKQESYPKIN